MNGAAPSVDAVSLYEFVSTLHDGRQPFEWDVNPNGESYGTCGSAGTLFSTPHGDYWARCTDYHEMARALYERYRDAIM